MRSATPCGLSQNRYGWRAHRLSPGQSRCVMPSPPKNDRGPKSSCMNCHRTGSRARPARCAIVAIVTIYVGWPVLEACRPGAPPVGDRRGAKEARVGREGHGGPVRRRRCSGGPQGTGTDRARHERGDRDPDGRVAQRPKDRRCGGARGPRIGDSRDLRLDRQQREGNRATRLEEVLRDSDRAAPGDDPRGLHRRFQKAGL